MSKQISSRFVLPACSGCALNCARGVMQTGIKIRRGSSFHHVAAIVSLLAIGSVVAVRLHDDFSGFYQTFFPLLDWLALSRSLY